MSVMAGTVVSMKVISLVIAVAEGAVVNVTRACQEVGVSRKTFYAYLSRYRAEGTAALEPRSRRPHRSPLQTPAVVEDEVVRLRKELADAGLDHGATTIQWHLGRRGGFVPSVASVHRILVRRSLVVAQPRQSLRPWYPSLHHQLQLPSKREPPSTSPIHSG